MGPRGHDEVNVAREAGYFGWPLFIGDNKAYHHRDFASGELGTAYDPAAPVNDSKLNTGAKNLPPAQPAMIYYPYAQSEEFPSMGTGGRNAMAGPVFYHADYNASEHRFPEYYDGKFFFYDWMRDQIMAADLDETGFVTSFERFLPDEDLRHPMDMLFGPDGDLYILEYGRKWFDRNSDARLLRIRFNAGNRAPVPVIALEEKIGGSPFQLSATSEGSIDYDGDDLSLTWYLNDEKVGEGPSIDQAIEVKGEYELKLVANDGQGNQTQTTERLLVGNSIPEVDIVTSGNRSFFFGKAPVEYEVKVRDAEDGAIDPKMITVSWDYLEGEDMVQIARGHQVAGEGTQFAQGKALIDGQDCSGCHLAREENIGPSYLMVAEKYRDRSDAVAYLGGKIISGGSGVWGARAMAAHPDISEADAEQMANYILSLAGPPPGRVSLPAKGQLALDKHRPGTPGRYILQASYTDQGGGDGLPRLTTTEVVVLRNPVLRADLYAKGNKVMRFHLDAKDNPMGDEEADLLVAGGGGWSNYGKLDLSGIGSIKTVVALAPGRTAGGTITVVAGDPNTGKKLGEASIVQGLTTLGVNELVIPLADVPTGPEEIYFRYKADDDGPEAVLGAVISYEFLPAGVSKK